MGESTRSELESLIGEWRCFPDPEVVETVGRCYQDAGRQVEELRTAGQLDAARVRWAAKFGQPGPSFHGVRMQIFQALGGYDAEGPTDFTLPYAPGHFGQYSDTSCQPELVHLSRDKVTSLAS